MRAFSPSFFRTKRAHTQAYPSQDDYFNDDDSDTESSTSSFKLNPDACLNIFNGLLTMAERPLSSPERRAYLQNIQHINLKDEPSSVAGVDSKARGESSDDQAEERPPQNLKDIFKISNRNRKKNKQKKKVCKVFESSETNYST